MSQAVFLSKTTEYTGSYLFVRQSALNESNYALHYHNFYEVQFYLSEAENETIGEITINGRRRELTTGCLVLINMFDVHQLRITTTQPYVRYCLSFDSSLLLFACSENTNLFNIFSHSGEPRYSMPLSNDEIDTFVGIYQRRETMALTHGQDIMEKAMILELFAHIYDVFYDGQEIGSAESKGLETVTRLLAYIDSHLSEELSLERLAAEAHFSTFYLSHLFKQYTGTTLTQYVISKRIDMARILLHGDLPITQIAQEVGFRNYNHFYRTFKALTGVGPAEYRTAQER